MHKHLYLATLLALASLSSQGAALNDITERALAKSPEVNARLHEFFASEADQDAGRGALRPRVDVEAYAGRERYSSPSIAANNFNHPGANIQLRQLLLDGGATSSEVRRLGFAKATRYYELLQATNDTALEVARASIDVQRYRQLSTLAQGNWAVHKEIYDQIGARVKAGVGRRVDLEQAAGRLALAQSNWLTETSNLHDVGARFERVVGEPAPVQLDVPDLKRTLPTEKEVLSEAVKNNPQFSAAVANLRAARAQTDVRRAAYAPTVEFRASAGSQRNVDGVRGAYNDAVAQIVLNYNLYKGGTDSARIRQAQEQYTAAIDLRDKSCRDVRQTTAIAWNDVRKLRDQIQFLEQHQLSTEKARDAYRQQFDIGQRSLLDVLDTENELFQARRALVAAQYDLRLAEYRVLNGTNRLLSSLGLADPVKNTPEEAVSTERAEDPAVQCNTEMPAYQKLDYDAAMAGRPAAPPVPVPPAPASAPAAVPAAALPAQCEFAVKDWAAAWSAKDLKKYLGYYSDSFQPLTVADRDGWRQLRAARLNKPSISVELENVKAKQLSGDSCEVSFNQHYRSSDYNDDVAKVLVLKRENNGWKVIREVAPKKSSTN